MTFEEWWAEHAKFLGMEAKSDREPHARAAWDAATAFERDRTTASWEMPICACGRPTMHMGSVCYRCSQADDEKPADVPPTCEPTR